MDGRKSVFYSSTGTCSGWVFDGEAEGVCSRQEGPKTEKEREPTVESLDRRILRLKASDVERRVRDGE